MAAGDLKGTPLSVAQNSITNPTDATGSVAVVVGDLVYAVIFQQTALTANGVTDNLGNTYSPANAGTDAGTTTGRAFWARVTNAGTLTTVSFAATASANNVVAIAAVIEGPFQASPLDANPNNIANDNTTPYTCPATGTLAQASEAVLCWICHTGNPTFTASSPNTLALELNTATILNGAIGRQTVAATTSVAPEWTSTATPGDSCYGTTSFKLVVPLTGTTAFTATATVAVTATKFKGRSSLYGATGSLVTVATLVEPAAPLAVSAGLGAYGELAYGEGKTQALTISATTAFAGAGALATAAAHIVARATAFAASGTLATTRTRTIPRATTFSASGDLATIYTQSGTIQRTTAFDGVGSLATAASHIITRSTAFAASGTLVTNGAIEIPQLAIGGGFGAYGELAYGQVVVPSAAIAATTAFSASGSLSTTASVSGTFARTTTFAAAGTVSTSAVHIINRSTAFTAAATVATAAVHVVRRTTAFSASATVSTQSVRFLNRSTVFAGVGSMATVGTVGGVASRTTEFAAVANLSTTATATRRRSTAFVGAATASTSSTVSHRRVSVFAARGTMVSIYVPFAPRRFTTIGGVRRRFYETRRPVQPITRRPTHLHRRENVG